MRGMFFLVTTRKQLIWVGVAAFLVVATFAELAIAPGPKNPFRIPGRVIGIDPGHGGIDGGANDGRGFMEKDIVLDVARRLRVLLVRQGAVVHMTRNEDIELTDLGDPKEESEEVRDLQGRMKILNRANPAITLSLHINASLASYARGGMVFYKQGSEESKRLAQAIQEELWRIQPYNERSIDTANFHVLRNSRAQAAVLVELAFITNPLEYRLLATPSYRQMLAQAVANGIFTYFKMKEVE